MFNHRLSFCERLHGQGRRWKTCFWKSEERRRDGGKDESGGMGERENGGMGEGENGRMGEWGTNWLRDEISIMLLSGKNN